MKRTILIMIIALGLASVFTACEKNDYQHPGHRSGKY